MSSSSHAEVHSDKQVASDEAANNKVLIVDDLADSADTLRLILEMEGYDVKVAREGVSAICLAADFHPKVVILDIGMPGMDGCEVARQLRAQPGSSNSRLIALTGYSDEASRSRTRSAGFDHHVVKPADIEHLISLVSAS